MYQQMTAKLQYWIHMMWFVILLIVSSEAYRFHQLIPGDYVLDVEARCNPSPTGMVEVGVTTDLNVAVTAICKDNFTLEVTSIDDVNFWFYPAFSGDSSTQCVFNKREGINQYHVLAEVEWGEPETKIRPVLEMYLVTCSYDEYSQNASRIEAIGDSLIAPTEIQTHKGVHISSKITLRIVDVLGNPITGRIPRGKPVKLQGHSDGAAGEQGLSAVACEAVGNNGIHYAVLRAGCGDGIIFGRRAGFLTQGLDVSSPYFAVFNVKGSMSMQFHCNFTVCSGNCDGSSCRGRESIVKRSSDEGDAGEVGQNLDIEGSGDVSFRLDDTLQEEGLFVAHDQKASLYNDMTLRDTAQQEEDEDDDTKEEEPVWKTPLIIAAGAFGVLAAGVIVALLIHKRHRGSISLA